MPSWLWGLEAVDKKFSLSCEEVFARQRVVLKISTGQSSRVLQGSVKLFPSFERLRDLSVLKDYWDLLSNSYVTCSVMPQHALCRDNLWDIIPLSEETSGTEAELCCALWPVSCRWQSQMNLMHLHIHLPHQKESKCSALIRLGVFVDVGRHQTNGHLHSHLRFMPQHRSGHWTSQSDIQPECEEICLVM